jgi:tetratricopeptide (TPR) repeat protein
MGGYSNLTQTAAYQDWYSLARTGTRPVELEGLYLKGQGIVFSGTMPPTGYDPGVTAAKAAPKPLTEWERMRKEVRQEKVEAPEKNPRPKSPSPADIILKVLADNGRNLEQLGEDESVTVVLTFRGQRRQGGQFLKGGNNPYNSLGSQLGSAYNPQPNQGGSTARDYELLGDLHLKQGQPQTAIASFKKALERKPEPKQGAAIYRKLAQAYLALGQDDQAKKALDTAIEYGSKKSGGGAKKTAPARVSDLPSKLIITVSKKLLDRVGSGKMTFDAFKKAAKVEYLNFSEGGKGRKEAVR